MNKKKWLLISGSVLLSLVLFFIVFFQLTPPLTDIEQSSFKSFYLSSFIFPVLVAPLIEEIRFRGFLTKSKILQGIFLLLTPISLFVAGWDTIIFILVLVIYSIYALYKVYKFDALLDILIIVSSLFFSLHHLPFNANITWSWIPFLGVSFSLGLLFSWVIINKSIIWAFILHGGWNLVVSLLFLGHLHFGISEEPGEVISDEYHLEWKRIPFLNSNSGQYKPNGNVLTITNMNLQDVIGYAGPEILDSMLVTEPFVKYDITFQSENEAELKANFVKALEIDSLLIKKVK
ncbi:CPBP family intramembrane glutamic endopeptidase [Algoriphagus antarcticus]|uniref:CAAX prenyl protease-like protein n=1 Tax=Algoriphagus antarcticus TaxID=238540 RepID=A0A3E0E578_9BACT|nr:CPBP family intramembrane glutamic endopeptidase [Algoriphagus antarcticus]REG92116.1 CAAX prenyl protease-like protein [Algoriphagus antarcticus]